MKQCDNGGNELQCILIVVDATRQLNELRENASVLKSTIYRLNLELNRYQMQFRKLDDSEVRCQLL